MNTVIFQFGENAKRKLPPLPDYGNFIRPKDQVTRNSTAEPCGCSVCSIAREKVGGGVPLFKGEGNPLGRTHEKPDSPAAETLQVCNKCFSILQKGRGNRHICTKPQMEKNVVKLTKQRSLKGKEKIIKGLIENISSEKGVFTMGGIRFCGNG